MSSITIWILFLNEAIWRGFVPVWVFPISLSLSEWSLSKVCCISLWKSLEFACSAASQIGDVPRFVLSKIVSNRFQIVPQTKLIAFDCGLARTGNHPDRIFVVLVNSEWLPFRIYSFIGWQTFRKLKNYLSVIPILEKGNISFRDFLGIRHLQTKEPIRFSHFP